MKLIAIETKRYARTVEAFLTAHPDARAVLNHKETDEPVEAWCTNKKLRRLIDFELRDQGRVILGFHDHPRDLFAPLEQRPLVERLNREGVLSYRVLKQVPRPPGLLTRLSRRFGVPKRRLIGYLCFFGGGIVFAFAVFVGNPRELGLRILALVGWSIGAVGVGVHFYDGYHLLKNRFRNPFRDHE